MLSMIAGIAFADTSTSTTSTTATNATSTNPIKKNIGTRATSNYLESIIKGLIRQSENLKDRIIKNEYISDTLETSIVSEINGDITKLNDFLSQVKSASTNAQLKEIRLKLEAHKKDILNIRIRKVLAIINITKFAQNYTKNVEDRLKQIETKFGATATQEQKNSIAQAKTKLEEAKTALSALLTSVNSKPLSEFVKVDVNKELRAIQLKINEVKKLIEKIPQQIRKDIRQEKREERKEKKNATTTTPTAATTTP